MFSMILISIYFYLLFTWTESESMSVLIDKNIELASNGAGTSALRIVVFGFLFLSFLTWLAIWQCQ